MRNNAEQSMKSNVARSMNKSVPLFKNNNAKPHMNSSVQLFKTQLTKMNVLLSKNKNVRFNT